MTDEVKFFDWINKNTPPQLWCCYEEFNEILSFYLKNEQLNDNSIVVCHSIGNAYFARFCREHNFKPKHFVAVIPGAIYETPELIELVDELTKI